MCVNHFAGLERSAIVLTKPKEIKPNPKTAKVAPTVGGKPVTKRVTTEQQCKQSSKYNIKRTTSQNKDHRLNNNGNIFKSMMRTFIRLHAICGIIFVFTAGFLPGFKRL